MTRRQRLRRVALLCAHFVRNLAYYRAGGVGKKLKRKTEFWITVNGNFYDFCVLEWCKLFADPKDKHCWKKTVEDVEQFQTELLNDLGMTEDAYEDYLKAMRKYRDKFVAHLDSDNRADLPHLDSAQKAVSVYYAHLLELDKQEGFLGTLPRSIEEYFARCTAAGTEVYGGP